MVSGPRCWPFLALALAACETNPALYIELRSDLVPGVEVLVTHTTVSSGRNVVATIDHDVRSDDLVRGARIAEAASLPRGEYGVEVELESPSGSTVLTRRLLVTLTETYVLTVVASRSCIGVECPGVSAPAAATECIGGICVAPSCEIASDGCGIPCESAADCGTPAAACAMMECIEGTCFATPVDGACAPDEVCVPDTGCVEVVELPDSGLPMTDGGPPSCSSGCDDGNGCTNDSCVDGACQFTPNGNGCDDGNSCTYGDHCEGGGCTGSSYSCTPPPCMSVSCDGSGGCSVGGGCGPGSTCDGSTCVACGGADQRCCDGGGCNGGLWCYTGVCTCAQPGGPCCPWDNSCAGGTTCNGGTCCHAYGTSCSAGGPCCDGVPCRSGICIN